MSNSLFYEQFFLRSKGWFSSYRVFVTAAISDLQKKGEPELFSFLWSDSLTEARRNWSRKNQNVSISSDFVCDSVAYDPVKPTLSELEAEAEKPTNHKAWNRLLWLVYSSASTQFWPSLGRKRESHKQNRCYVSDSVGLIFTRSYHSTFLITLGKTSLRVSLTEFYLTGGDSGIIWQWYILEPPTQLKLGRARSRSRFFSCASPPKHFSSAGTPWRKTKACEPGKFLNWNCPTFPKQHHQVHENS